jgi:CheY-like chemotaxis protein
MKTALIVDDEPTVCRMVKSIIESSGEYEATGCTSSAEALELATRLQPDIILLDVRMPGLSGSEIAEKLKDEPATKNIPIIFLTGMVKAAEVKEGGYKIGGNYFVAKPARKAELMHVIDLALREKQRGADTQEPVSKEKAVHVTKLLGHTVKIRPDSEGYFQLSIAGLKPVKQGITFFALKDAQEAAHALIHYHVEGVHQCTCTKRLEWTQSNK